MYKPHDFRRATNTTCKGFMFFVGPQLSITDRRRLMPEMEYVQSEKAYVLYRNGWDAEQAAAHFNERFGLRESPFTAVVEAVTSGVPDPRKAAKWRGGAKFFKNPDAVVAVADLIERGDVPAWADIRAADIVDYMNEPDWAEAKKRWTYFVAGNQEGWTRLVAAIAAAIAPF